MAEVPSSSDSMRRAAPFSNTIFTPGSIVRIASRLPLPMERSSLSAELPTCQGTPYERIVVSTWNPPPASTVSGAMRISSFALPVYVPSGTEPTADSPSSIG